MPAGNTIAGLWPKGSQVLVFGALNAWTRFSLPMSLLVIVLAVTAVNLIYAGLRAPV